MKETKKLENLDLENYRMMTNQIIEQSKKIDFYIKLNLTVFLAVFTLVLSNINKNNMLLIYSFIPLSVLNYVSFRYFDAIQRLIVSYQAHIASTYETDMKYGWFLQSLKYRERDRSNEKKIKHSFSSFFSPNRFYISLMIINLIAFLGLNLYFWGLDNIWNVYNFRAIFFIIFSLVYIGFSLKFCYQIYNNPKWSKRFKDKYNKWNDELE